MKNNKDSIRLNYVLLKGVQFLSDMLVVCFSYFLSIYLRLIAGKPLSHDNIASIKLVLPYILLLYAIFYFIYKLYDIESLDSYETFLGIFFSTILIFLLTLALSFFLRAFAVPRTIIIGSFFLQLIFLLLSHYLISLIYDKVIPPQDIAVITKSVDQENKVLEYLGRLRRGKVNLSLLTVDTLDFKEKIEKVLDSYDLFVVDDSFTLFEKDEIVKFLAYLDKPFYIVPGLYGLLLLNPNLHFINDLTLFEVYVVNFSPIERIIKRLIDIVFSIVTLVIFSPVIFIVSIAIVLDSGLPIFYLQERVGERGKIFKTIKFRTMIKDAEKHTGAVLSSENDPRITRVGRFLRKTGLDEVPQFINVLKGEMSVVGPRPERPELIEKIKKDVPYFDLRLLMKPGITGFAQLYGKYDTSFEDKLKMDLAYAKSRHIILTDIYIIFNTIKLFLSPHKRK
ncbi:sugar transferase [Caldisericum exile]|uniref:Glycosyltransferase n=1 Tax=Caldisericum exile (strain DSM 21853 / NBRC 104410 / AZM16c01) TaxID=511051 RepID=A0A7U6GFY0_CALEA|nr:sugar transferase [Caldisericum exile]BAL81655.1 putative glycosyltransferase [Caldisericum exile AZM16c01]